MTNEQKQMIQKYREEFEASCKKYARWGSQRDCSFGLFASENPEDQNFTMLVTTITGISDDYETYVETVNLMVEPDGNVINLKDVYNSNEVVSYIEKLKKID